MKKILVAVSILFSVGNIHAQNLKWIRKSFDDTVVRATYSVSFSADGSKVFSGSQCSPSILRIFNTDTGNVLWNYKLNDSIMCVQGAKLSSNGQKAAAIEELGNLLIFDYTTTPPTLQNVVHLGVKNSYAVNFSPDGSKVAIGNSNKKMFIYDSGGALIHDVDAHQNWVYCIDWSKGEKIATGGDDALVKLWDTSGNLIRTMTGHSGGILGVKISPDGNYVVSCSKDKTVKVWDASNGTCLRTLVGHTANIKSVDISDDGNKIVSGGDDSTIKVWDINNGALLASFGIPEAGSIYSVDFSPNGRYVLTGTGNGDVQLWDMMFRTGVKQVTADKTEIYPNPCTNELHVKNTGVDDVLSISDATGKTFNAVVRKIDNDILINTSTLPSANYFLTIQKGYKTETVHFIKK